MTCDVLLECGVMYIYVMQCVWCLNEFHEHSTGRALLYAFRSYVYNNSATPTDPSNGQVSDSCYDYSDTLTDPNRTGE